MRTMGAVLCLIAVAALFVSVSKAEGHRHDEPGCSCSDVNVGVESSASSFDTADVELASNDCGITLNVEIDQLAMKAAPRREAIDKHAASTIGADLYDRESGPGVLKVGA